MAIPFLSCHLCDYLSQDLGVTLVSPLASVTLSPPAHIHHPVLNAESPFLHLCYQCCNGSLPQLSVSRARRKHLTCAPSNTFVFLNPFSLLRLESNALKLQVQQSPFHLYFFQ